MPLKNYGVLRGRVVDHRPASGPGDHLHLHMVDRAKHYRIAVNVHSKLAPSELQYVIDSDFRHPIIQQVAALPAGWTALGRKPGTAALDFIRGNLVDRRDLRALPFAVPGPDNDLNEKLAHYVRRATADARAMAYAFGERWGPQHEAPDALFGFRPSNGVHDIHMNQSNAGKFADDDGVYQDGALLLHFPSQAQWVAIFLKFQSQGWHTDDVTGHAIARPKAPGAASPDGTVRIVAALVDAGASRFLTLLNTTAQAIDLAGWTLADRDKRTMALTGQLAAGATLRLALVDAIALPAGGGALTLLDAAGLKVDGVSYTGEQVLPGRTMVFRG